MVLEDDICRHFSSVSARRLLAGREKGFARCPKNYPLFVRQYLMSKLPAGARTDLMRMKKAGFGLAESPRLWYKRFKRGAESVGGRELHLCPGVFAFFQGGRVIALLAVHVDDVRLITDNEHEKVMMKGSIPFLRLGNGFTRCNGRSSVAVLRSKCQMGLSTCRWTSMPSVW